MTRLGWVSIDDRLDLGGCIEILIHWIVIGVQTHFTGVRLNAKNHEPSSFSTEALYDTIDN